MSASIGRCGWILLWGIVLATQGEPLDGKRPAGLEIVSVQAMQPLPPALTGFNPRYVGPSPLLPYYQFYAPMPIPPPLPVESSRMIPNNTQKPQDKTGGVLPADPDLHTTAVRDDSNGKGAAVVIDRKNNGNNASTVTTDRNSTDSKPGNKKEKDGDVMGTKDGGTSGSDWGLSASTGNGTKNTNSSNGKNVDDGMSGSESSEEDSSSGSGSGSTDADSSSGSGSGSTDPESSSGSGSGSTKEADVESRESPFSGRPYRRGRSDSDHRSRPFKHYNKLASFRLSESDRESRERRSKNGRGRGEWREWLAKIWNRSKKNRAGPKTRGSGKDDKTDTPTTNTVIERPTEKITITLSDKISAQDLQKRIEKYSNGAIPAVRIVKQLAKQQNGGVAKLENKTNELKPGNSSSTPAENDLPDDERTKVLKDLAREMKQIVFNITRKVNEPKQYVLHKNTHHPTHDIQDRNMQLLNQDSETTKREGTIRTEKEDTNSKQNLGQEPLSDMKRTRLGRSGRKESRRRMNESLSTGETVDSEDDLETSKGAKKTPTLMEWIIGQANQTKLGKLILSYLPLAWEAMEDTGDRIASRLQITWDRLNTELAIPGEEESRIRSVIANIPSD